MLEKEPVVQCQAMQSMMNTFQQVIHVEHHRMRNLATRTKHVANVQVHFV